MAIKLLIDSNNSTIYAYTKKELPIVVKRELTDCKVELVDSIFVYTMPLLSYNAFIWNSLLKVKRDYISIDDDSLMFLESYSERTSEPNATVDNTHIIFDLPAIPTYKRLMLLLNASNFRLTLYKVPFSRLYEAYRYIVSFNHPFLPKINMSDDLINKLTNTLSEHEDLQTLFSVDLYELTSIKNGYQIDSKGFEKLKYSSAVDLLFKKPSYYLDRTTNLTKNLIPYGVPVYVKGVINYISSNLNKALEIEILDKNKDSIKTYLFGLTWKSKMFNVGDVVYLNVTRTSANTFKGNSVISLEEVESLPIAPVYRQSPKAKITTNVLTNSVQELLLRFNGEKMAPYFKDKKLWENIKDLHFPKDGENLEKTLENLAFIELCYLQLLFLEKSLNTKQRPGISKNKPKNNLLEKAIDCLPYSLTTGEHGQDGAIKHIKEKLSSELAENILLSGDVGAGKTLVASASALYNYDCGYQTAIVAPTEILAQQLYSIFKSFVEPLSIKPNIAYLSGNTKAKEKAEIEFAVKSGAIDVVIGTHAVINIDYNNLGLIIIDEQQKFGAAQTDKLLEKRKDGHIPDVLSQTATPIPRSTALAFYGDVSLVTLTEKPKGRKENITKWVKKNSEVFLLELFSEEWDHIFSEIERGKQVFVVTPTVNSNTKSASVKKTEEILKQRFPQLKIDYVHGGMKKDEQNKVLTKFRDNKTNILIASSIVEVGIDIPNSTVMLVLDANRFGASSLHQIRGRVGRNSEQGYCYLVAEDSNVNSRRRLQSLVDSNNGFDIALIDLETRKEGDLFGVKQSGETKLKFCDLINHTNLIEPAKNKAIEIYNSQYKDLALSDAKTFLKQEDTE